MEVKPDGITTTLFLPASGHRTGLSALLAFQGTTGYYWSATTTGTDAYRLSFSKSNVNPSNAGGRGDGMTLRCISR